METLQAAAAHRQNERTQVAWRVSRPTAESPGRTPRAPWKLQRRSRPQRKRMHSKCLTSILGPYGHTQIPASRGNSMNAPWQLQSHACRGAGPPIIFAAVPAPPPAEMTAPACPKCATILTCAPLTDGPKSHLSRKPWRQAPPDRQKKQKAWNTRGPHEQ